MKKQNISIRAMTDEDVPEVSNIVCSGYNSLAKLEGFTPEETTCLIAELASQESISDQRRNYHFTVAAFGKYVVGAVAVDGNEIEKSYVNPNLGRQGIGAALFEAAERHIADAGYDEIRLGAFSSAAGFYKAMGMELDGRRVNVGDPIKGRNTLLFKKLLFDRDQDKP